jgi:hypothetical protein
MLKQKDFWIGVLVGVAAYYIYMNHLKGKGKGA